MKMVKCLPEFEYFIVFLKNKNIISKFERSKVTDYAALTLMKCFIIFRFLPIEVYFTLTIFTQTS